jgi:hypothetical protein
MLGAAAHRQQRLASPLVLLHPCNMSLRPVPSLGFVAALLLVAAGCGGDSNDTEGRSPIPPEETAPRSYRPTPPPRSFAPPNDPAPPRPAPPSEAELSAAQRARYVEAVQSVDTLLERHCGSCHSKSVPAAPCGLRFDHTDDLVAVGLLAPLSAETSRVVQVIADGSMPPPGVMPRPTPSELDQLRAFIDDPSSWSQQPLTSRDPDQAYADARSNACDAATEPGVDAGAPDAGLASP